MDGAGTGRGSGPALRQARTRTDVATRLSTLRKQSSHPDGLCCRIEEKLWLGHSCAALSLSDCHWTQKGG
jgi:hypothetical protein